MSEISETKIKSMTREEIIEFCEMKAELEPENEDIYEVIIKVLEKQPSEDTEVIKVSKGAVKARQGKFVIYDVEWLKKNFYTTEEKIYGQPKESCEDCISREAALEQARDYGSKTFLIPVNSIKALPPVTPKQKIGEWIDIEYFDREWREWTCYRPKCPFCNAEPKEYSNYCPNCGARLKEEDPDY